MRIAQVAPIVCRVPPTKYGGTERVVHTLTEGLVKRGHDVTLFASGDSQTSARLVSTVPKSLITTRKKDIYGLNTFTLQHIGTAYSMQDQFDVIHDHHWVVSLPTAHIATTPVLMPMHNPFTEENIELYKKFTNPYIVTLSDAQYPKNLHLPNYLGTVYNGLNMKNYPHSCNPKDYLLYVGRISDKKGTLEAIKAAKRAKMKLVIAAKIASEDGPHYYERHIKPHLGNQIKFIGQVDEQKRNKLMCNAKAFLHPAKFQEPFGLTLIEAMACACPVIAFRKGSIPEIIEDGKTGFVVDNVPQMTTAIKKIDTIDREYTRRYALSKFNADRMVMGYEKLYKKIIQISKSEKARRIRPYQGRVRPT